MSDLQDRTGMIPEPLEAKADRMPPSTAGMTTKVVKGSLWTLAGQVAPLGVSLVTTPFTIRLLGAEGYGVLILVGLIPTYLGFADFGMSMASTKFGSEAYAEGDEEKEGRIVRTAALIALMTSVPVAALLIFFAGQIIGLFNVPPELSSDAVLALRLASITFVINFLCGIFNTPQLARLRMDLNTFINASSRILGLLATPLVLYLGYGIVGAVTVLLAASILNLTGHLIVSRRLLPHLVGTTIDRSAIRSVIKFGGGFIIASIAGMLLGNIEKGLLSSLVSVTSLAYYSVAFALAGMLTMFSASMVQSLFPAFARLQSEENRIQRNSMYSVAITMTVIWVLPVLVFLSFVAEGFFTIWAGAEFGRESTVPFYILAVGLGFNLLAYVPSAAIMAAGRTDALATLYWIELVPYFFCVWLLTARFGIYGAAAAWSVRAIIDLFAVLYLARSVSNVSFQSGRFGRLVLSSIPLVAVFILGRIIDGWVTLPLLISVGILSYCLFVWYVVLQKEELTWVCSRFGTRSASGGSGIV